MFPSSIGENPIFPQFQQSVYSTYGGPNGNVNSSLHHNNDLLEVSATTAPAGDNVNNLVASIEPAFTNQGMSRLNGVHSTQLGNLSTQKSRRAKPDRHSKIVTAQGPRDRRVRLSIDIAQKFFGLQDMLGFDKASKTIDWLLTKSKAAIEEVVQMKLHSGRAFEDAENGDLEGKYSRESQPEKVVVDDPRANARARARERTRKKRCITNPKDESAYHVIQEPLSIKRKTKPSIFAQPDLICSNDATSGHYCVPYTNEQWNTTNTYDMISISSSKVVQIAGTPLEDTSNS